MPVWMNDINNIDIFFPFYAGNNSTIRSDLMPPATPRTLNMKVAGIDSGTGLQVAAKPILLAVPQSSPSSCVLVCL